MPLLYTDNKLFLFLFYVVRGADFACFSPLVSACFDLVVQCILYKVFNPMDKKKEDTNLKSFLPAKAGRVFTFEEAKVR